eukprot:355651-Prorocentrum_minimum.AAC.3
MNLNCDENMTVQVESVGSDGTPSSPVVVDEEAELDVIESVLTELAEMRERLADSIHKVKRVRREKRAEAKKQRKLLLSAVATASKSNNSKTRKARADQAARTKSKSHVSGFTKPVGISDVLSRFLGVPETELVARNVVNRRISEYIKSNGLQDQNNKQFFTIDAALSELLGLGVGESLHFFKLQRYMKTHYVKKTATATATATAPVVENSTVEVVISNLSGVKPGVTVLAKNHEVGLVIHHLAAFVLCVVERGLFDDVVRVQGSVDRATPRALRHRHLGVVPRAPDLRRDARKNLVADRARQQREVGKLENVASDLEPVHEVVGVVDADVEEHLAVVHHGVEVPVEGALHLGDAHPVGNQVAHDGHLREGVQMRRDEEGGAAVGERVHEGGDEGGRGHGLGGPTRLVADDQGIPVGVPQDPAGLRHLHSEGRPTQRDVVGAVHAGEDRPVRAQYELGLRLREHEVPALRQRDV